MFRTCSNNLFRSLPAVGIYSNNAWSQKKEDAPVTRIGPPPVSIPSFSPARVSYPPKLSPPSLLSNISYPKDSPLKQSQLIQKIQQIQKECLNPPEIKTPLSAAPSIEVSSEKEIPEAAPTASDIVDSSIEKTADATDENPAADPKPSEGEGAAEVACLEKESPPIERSVPAILPQESSLGWPLPSLSFLSSNIAYAEPLPEKIPEGYSPEQNRLVQKILKGRLDSPTKEIQRLIKEGFVSKEEETELNKMFTPKQGAAKALYAQALALIDSPTKEVRRLIKEGFVSKEPDQEDAKALYAQALALKKVLGTSHYIFLHGQAHQWTLYADIMKEVVKREIPWMDVHQYKILRYPELLKQKGNIKSYKNNIDTHDHSFEARRDLLSVDGYFYNTQYAESCHSFFVRNRNMIEGPDYTISKDLHKFYPYIHQAFLRTAVHELYEKSLNKKSCGNLIVIAVPKSLENAHYRSHAVGKACNCHPEEMDVQILESLQKNKLPAEALCNEDYKIPQYRLYLPKISPENNCRIYILSPEKKRKETKHEIKEMLDSLHSSEKVDNLVRVALKRFQSDFYDLASMKDAQFISTITKPKLWEFEGAEDSLKEVKRFVTSAVSMDGMSFEFVDVSLRGEIEIARAAVTQNGMALQFAHPLLKKNPEIVNIAVRQNGMALEFADDSFKKDIEIARAAVRQNRGALQFVDSSIQMTLAFELGFGV